MKPSMSLNKIIRVIKENIITLVKERDKLKISKFFIGLLLISTPFIDLLNGFISQFIKVSPGQIIRPLFMLVAFGLVYFFSKRAFLYINIIIGLMAGTLIIYFILSKDSILDQILWDARIMYTLILTILFINVLPKLKEKFINNSITYLEFSVAFISFVIILSAVTQTGFNTYEAGQGVGNKGFFIGQNDITAVISMSFPFLLYRLLREKHNKVIRSVNIFLVLFAALLLGTKSGLIFIFLSICGVLYLLISPSKIIDFCKEKSKFVLIVLGLILIPTVTFIIYFKDSIEKWINYQTYFFSNSNSFLTFLLSGRNKSVLPMFEVIREHPIYILIGSTFNKGQELISSKLGFPAFIEFDPLSIFYYNGLLIFVLYIFVFITLFKYLPNLLKSPIKNKIILLSFCIGVIYSSMGGHVLPSGIAGTYFAYICGLVHFYGKNPLKNEN